MRCAHRYGRNRNTSRQAKDIQITMTAACEEPAPELQNFALILRFFVLEIALDKLDPTAQRYCTLHLQPLDETGRD